MNMGKKIGGVVLIIVFGYLFVTTLWNSYLFNWNSAELAGRNVGTIIVLGFFGYFIYWGYRGIKWW